MYDVEPHDKAKEKIGCKGLIFRARVNNYYSNGRVGFERTLTKLKRKSCPGCNMCSWIEDSLPDDIECNCVIIPSDLKDNGLYELKVVNMSTDYETGIADEWELEFVYIDDKT